MFNLTLVTESESSEFSSHFNVVVERFSESGGEVANFSFVFLSDIGQGNAGGVLLVNQLSEFGSSSNETVGNVHSSAEGWHPEDELNRIDIGSNCDKFGLFVFDEFGDMVDSEFQDVWFLLIDVLL